MFYPDCIFPLGPQKVPEKASISPASIDFTAKLAFGLLHYPRTAYLEKPQGRGSTRAPRRFVA
jgi:hypothetical protein